MTTPRRCLIRPDRSSDHSQVTRQIQILRTKLAKDRADLARWMSRLKRAFTFVQKHQHRIARLERQIAKLEGG